MHFPVILHLGPLSIAPHQPMEMLGAFLGFRLYLRQRRRAGDPIPGERRLVVLAAAIVGAALGSKLLAIAAAPPATLGGLLDVRLLLAGKTIVGGLLGGLAATELVKWRIGERTPTGDLYAFPLIVGIALGRVGCFLTGLADDTYGVATSLPWGIDFGDGVRRHPTQLYEIAFLALLAVALAWRARRPYPRGDRFKLFMVGYLAWRLAVDFIKPSHVTLLGLNPIQLACIAGLLWYAPHLPRLFGIGRRARAPSADAVPSPESASPQPTAGPAWQTR
ncbi:MAG TPA: prolipoprotein diacylglyceryl transferase family protein [Longimicrobium sp.]|nr:prolipoprotein diacylglyceryl transferase family protein [Longimicrobium sp.]